MKQLIDKILFHNPFAFIVVAKLIPTTRQYMPSINQLNQQIPLMVQRKNTVTSPVILADHFTGYDAKNDNHDGLHPNVSGSKKMAGVWMNRLVEYLEN